MGTVLGGIAIYAFTSMQISSMKNDIIRLSDILDNFSIPNVRSNETENVYLNGTSLSAIYSQVKDSVVLIMGEVSGGYVLGSGFVYDYVGTMVVVTNYHVVNGTSNLSVTFSDGTGYTATVLGIDPYSDLAVISANAPTIKLRPLKVIATSDVNVGDIVIAVGNPYGLIDSATIGIISGKGRTMTENQTGSVIIANVIQSSAPINPGNSGGPLLNTLGEVVGINTASVQGSEALGFAIPADTIVREIGALIITGEYTNHSDLGATWIDNNYLNAQELVITTTYGAIITSIASGGPSAGNLRVDDVITSVNGTLVTGADELSTYLEKNTHPGDTLELNISRQSTQLNVSIKLGRLV